MPPDLFFTTRAASVRDAGKGHSAPATLDETARSVGVVLATETPATVWDWERGVIQEVLLMSGAEFPAQVPLLDSHSRYSVESQLGSLRDISVAGSELLATAFLANVRAALDAFAKIQDGHLTDISVGYRILDTVWIPKDETALIDGREFSGPLRVVRKWQVKEGSLTPIGADEQAKIRSAAEALHKNPEEAMPPVKDNLQRGAASGQHSTTPAQNIPPEESARAAAAPGGQRTDTSQSPASAPLSTDAGRSGAEETAQRTAFAEMINLGLRHGCPELAETAIRSGVSLDAFRAQVLDHIGAASERDAPRHTVAVGETDETKYRAAASDALLMRSSLGGGIKNPAPGAADLRGYDLREFARECCRRSGIAVGGDVMEMVGRAFTSTSDFPAILADTAHRAVRMGAAEAAETFEVWTGESNATDFREHTGVSLDSFSTLDLVPEGGEYHHGQTSDGKVPYSVATYGKLFSITRQAIVNNDFNVLTKIPAAMGRAGMRTVGNLVYGIVTGNPQLVDGVALFSGSRNNLAAAGGKVNVDTFNAGVVAMGTHADAQGTALNIAPVFMLLPIALRSLAHQLLNTQVIGTQAQPNVANPWYGAVQPVTDARLDTADNKAWYLLAGKGQSVDVAWLGGNKTPRVEQRQGWSIDGVDYKVSIDAGAFVSDWRGLYKNPGA